MAIYHHENFKKIWNEHNDSSWKVYRILTMISGIVILGVLIFFIYGQFFVKHPVIQYGNPYTLDTEFTYTRPDGETITFTAPYRIEGVEIGEPVTVKTVLPDNITDGMYLCYYGGHNVVIEIDGEVRFTHNYEMSEYPGRVIKSIYFNVPLSSDDCGKEMVLIKDEDKVNNASINQMFYGTLDVINSYLYLKYKTPFILALFLFFGSSILCLVGWVLMRRGGGNLSIRYFAEGVMIVSWWIICDSPTYQFALNNYYIDGLTGYMVAPLIIIPFINFFNHIQKRRYERIYNIMMVVQLVLIVPYYYLHFADILPFERMLLPMNLILGLELAILIGVIAYDSRKGLAKSYHAIIVGVIALAALSIIELVLINIHININEVLILTGLYIACGCAVINSFREYMAMENDKADALRASVMKTHFLANMSHKLRTPINSIVGMNEMILRETEDPAIREYAEYVDRSSKLLLGLISDVLDISKIEAGKIHSQNNEYQAAHMLGVMADILDERTASKQLSSNINISSAIPCRLKGDEQHITQIMLNLLSNATKYTEQGSVSLAAEFVKTDGDKGILRFRVADTGIGIEEENIDKIFDSFSRFDEDRNKYIQGTGLGLAITKELVRVMDGQISVSSVYGEGTTFTVEIPQRIVEETPIGDDWRVVAHKNSAKAGSAKGFTAPKAKILAVDDNFANLMIVKQFLKKSQANVDTASNGAEAIEKCKWNIYDLILIDHMMPVMNGIDANKHIRGDADSLNRNTPVIILTANALSGSREEYLRLGFADYMSKPLQYDLFENTILKYLPEDKVQIIGDVDVEPEMEEVDNNIIEEDKKVSATIDLNMLVDIYGDEDFAKEIVEKVAIDTLEALDRMQSSYEAKDYNQYRIDAHGIKGMMASIYVAPMQEWAKKHEFAVKEDNFGFIDEDLASFDKAVREFCNEILNK